MATNKRNYWKELSLSDKAQLFPLFIEQGIVDKKQMEEMYNNMYSEGGNMYGPGGHVAGLPFTKLVSKGAEVIKNKFKEAKDRWNNYTDEQKQQAIDYTANTLSNTIDNVGLMVPQVNIPISGKIAVQEIKKGNYEEAIQAAMLPIFTGSIRRPLKGIIKKAERTTNSKFLPPLSSEEVANMRDISTKLADFNYKLPKVEITESPVSVSKYGNMKLIRNISGLPEGSLEEGITLAPQKNIFGNFTTDVPFRLHSSYSYMPGGEAMIIEPEAFRGIRPWSIEPMDTFFRANELTGIDPKYITLVSGSEKTLQGAKNLGMKVRTNQGLIDEYSKIEEYISKYLKPSEQTTGRFNLNKQYTGWHGVPLDVIQKYRHILDDTISKVGRPTRADYVTLEKVTGLKSHTSPFVREGIAELNDAINTLENGLPTDRTMKSWIAYPGGSDMSMVQFKKQMPYLISQSPFYKNVFYNPIPTTESDLLRIIGGHGHQEYNPAYDEALQYLFDNYVNSNPIKKYGGLLKIFEDGDDKSILTSSGELPAAIITPDKDYSYFLNSLPDNQRFTPESDYSTKRYWELKGKPKDFEEAKKLGMYTYDHSDKSWHANSVAWGKDGIGYFMKPKHHDTLKYELDWYNNGLVTEEGGAQRKVSGEEYNDWKNFINAYDLDTSGEFYRYVPKAFSDGGNLYGLGSWINKGIGKLRQLIGWKKPIDNNSTSGYEWSDDQITDIAKAFETYQNKAYIGVKGDVLGGYGHKMTKDEIGKYWDSEKQEAKETIPDRVIQGWLKSDMDTAFNSVDTYYGKDIPSNIRAALAALSFQGGDKLIRGKRDDAGNIVDSWGGSPNFERAVKAYIKDNSQDNLNAIFNQMQYKDDNKSNMRGLSSRYGLYRAIVENIADPKKVQEYKDSATFNLYRSNKTK